MYAKKEKFTFYYKFIFKLPSTKNCGQCVLTHVWKSVQYVIDTM